MITDKTYTNNCCVLQNLIKSKTEAFHKRLKKLYPCVDDVTKLPQEWSTVGKATHLGLTSDHLGCYFRGRRMLDENKLTAAVVRADSIIPPSCLLYYFEIEFLSRGREGFIGLGLSTDLPPPPDRLPGWDRESYRYESDDGHIFGGNATGRGYGPISSAGDVVGCGYNLVEGKIFFTRNGTCLGKAFDDVPSNRLFYPTIGLRTPGEEIRVNFGQKEFRYDIEQDLRSLRKNMTFTISNYPISDFGNWQNTLHKLVQSWLLQNSYPNTAEAFTKSARIECKENIQRVQQRNRIQQLVMDGKISEAIKLTNCIYPDLLHQNDKLLFKLKCRQFIELISGAENDFQPLFNYKPDDNFSSNSGDNSNKSSNGISMSKVDSNGDQLELPPPAQPTNLQNNTTTEFNNADNGNSYGTTRSGFNGMTGDKNCEKVDDQHSTSSSSYQELMDVDQPAPQSSNNDSSNNNHRNSSICNDMTNNTRPSINIDNCSPSANNNGNSAHNEQDGMLTNVTNKQDNDSLNNSTKIVDTELDCNEQKFAKLILFGQELKDFLNRIEEMYGKDDANEKMLHEAISLIAYINPNSEPHVRKQLDPSRREQISQMLNNSILEWSAIPGQYYKELSKPDLGKVMSHLKSLVCLNNSQGLWLVDRLF